MYKICSTFDSTDAGNIGPVLDALRADAGGTAVLVTPAFPDPAHRPDGVILATPNQLHVGGGLECVAARVPVIVEKPIGDTVEGAIRLVEAAGGGRGPVLTGTTATTARSWRGAREIVQERCARVDRRRGGDGAVLQARRLLRRRGGWRRQPGGGPILLNLIHEVNNLQSLVGDIVRVQATTSNATRGFDVEDTAAMVFTFANGALGTFLLSDTAASPRSWEQTSRENPATRAIRTRTATTSPARGDRCRCRRCGSGSTRGALLVGAVRVSTVELERSDPLANQVEHFAAVIRGEAEPSAAGGTAQDAAGGGRRRRVGEDGAPVDLRYLIGGARRVRCGGVECCSARARGQGRRRVRRCW